MAQRNRTSLGLVLTMASAPALGLFVAVLLRYGLVDAWERVAYAVWGVAAVGLMLVIVLAVTLASAFAASAAARAFRPRR